MRQLRLAEAIEAYRAAWALERTFELACNIGRLEFRRGHTREAAEFLTRCVKSAPAAKTAAEEERRAEEEGEMVEARRQVATLSIRVNVEGAAITMDSKMLGASPLSEEVFVDPGDHVIEAKAAGFTPGRQEIRVNAGSLTEIALKLGCPAAPASCAEAAPMAARDEALRRSSQTSYNPLLLAIGTSGAILGLTMGVTGAVVSGQRSNDAIKATARLAEYGDLNVCHDKSRSPPECDEQQSAHVDSGLYQNLGFIGFSVAGIAGTATLMYALMPEDRAADMPVHAMLGPVPGGGVFVLTGSF